jgi:predicted GIY-YIG superfamily endonuclease
MIGTDITTMTRRELFDMSGYGETVYRLYDAAETLLYVGVAGMIETRFSQHRAKKPWWPQVVHKTAVWYRTRIEALSFEALAIHDERPVYNIRKDRPLPVRADGTPGGWIHMIPESTVRYTVDSIVAIVNKHNLTVGVAAQGSRHCRAIILPAEWYERTADAMSDAVTSELEK